MLIPQSLEVTQPSEQVPFFIREIPISLTEISPAEFLALYSALTIVLTYIGTKSLYDLLDHGAEFSAKQIIVRLIAMLATAGISLGIFLELLSTLQNKQEEQALILVFFVFTIGTFAFVSFLSLLKYNGDQQ